MWYIRVFRTTVELAKFMNDEALTAGQVKFVGHDAHQNMWYAVYYK